MAEEPKSEGAAPSAEPSPEPAKPAAPAKAAAPAAPKAEAKPAGAAHAAPKPPPPMAATPWESDLTKEIKERFGGDVAECSTYLGQNFLVIKPGALIPMLDFLKLEADYEYLVDVTAVDYPKKPERFEIVYILYSYSRNDRVRVKTSVAEGQKPASAVQVHLAANWLEREVFDMFGVEFEGHPDMRRILLPEEWEGFQLRKEYSIVKQDDRWVKENLGIESGQ